MNRHLYIFTEADSNAGGYGVGSYILNLLDALSIHEFYKITIVSVMTNDAIVKVTQEDRLRKINIPKLSPPTSLKRNYFQSVYYILYPFIDLRDRNYFHFNFFSSSKLARKIKENIENAVLLLTIHYFNEYDLKETGTDEDISTHLYHKIIVINKATETILRQKYRVKSNTLARIPNGVKDDCILIDTSKRAKIIKELGLAENNLHLLFVGRMDKNKNVDLLIRVFIKLSAVYDNIHLNIVGSGDFDSSFKAIDQLWGKISFFGKLDKENVYKLYQITDIGIIPSRYEELGYVAIEMMMHAIPVVANNMGGLSDLIKDNVTGLLFQLNSCKSQDEAEYLLYQKIESLIVNVRSRRELGDNARKFYLNHLTKEIYSEKMVALYMN